MTGHGFDGQENSGTEATIRVLSSTSAVYSLSKQQRVGGVVLLNTVPYVKNSGEKDTWKSDKSANT